MLYDEQLKNTMLDILENRVSSIANTILVLCNEGFSPNKRKSDILSWSSILIDAYENIDVFSEEQHRKLDNIYNSVLKL